MQGFDVNPTWLAAYKGRRRKPQRHKGDKEIFLLFLPLWFILELAMKRCPTCKQEFETATIFCPMDGEKLLSVDSDDPLVGELIDNKYLVEEKVGRGATATVYRATHVQLELPVALKVMHQRLTLDKTAIERFRREAIAG